MSNLQTQEAVNVYGVPQPSGFYSIIQIFRPGVTVALSSATSAGATSFVLSDASAISAGDALVFDIGQNADYLTVATVSGNTVTTTSAALNAHAANTQVFRPGPFTKTPGTPALLLDIEADADQSNTTSGASRGTYEVEWQWMQQGGLDQGAFYLHKKYEDATDIVFGNYIIFGCQGGILAANAAAGAASISVTNLYSNTNPSTGLQVLNIKAGDPILLSDGVNTELFIASSVTGSGPWTINLAAAPGAGNAVLLNSYSANARVCRLRYQGIIQSRNRDTDKTNLFQINAVGVFNRYGNAVGSSSASQVDGAGLFSTIVNSYAQTLPEVIVNPANLAASSIPVTVSEQDANVSAIIADILKQESAMVPSQSNNGLTISPTALDFPQVTSATQEAKVHGGTAPYTASSSNPSVAQVSLIGSDAVNTTTLKNTIGVGAKTFVVNTTTKAVNNTTTQSNTGSLAAGDLLLLDGGTQYAEFVIIASVNSSTSTITLSGATVYSHAAGATIQQYLRVVISAVGNGIATITVTDAGSLTVQESVAVGSTLKASSGALFAAWVDELRQIHHGVIPTSGTPTYTLDLQTGSVDGDILGPLQTTDMDGTGLINAAIVRGGQDASGNRIRISVLEEFSQQLLNAWYEGTLDNSDITDETALANWAASQLAILAYPLITAQLELTSASMRFNTTDLIQITGFDDGSTLLCNPVAIKFHAIANEQRVTAEVSLGVLGPDVDSVAREYAGEKSIRETYNTVKTNLTDTYVVSGFDFTETGGVNFTMSSGTVVYEGTSYAASAYSGAAPVGDSIYGVSVVNGIASISAMPYLRALGSRYATSQFGIHYRGGPPQYIAGGGNFIPLYKVTASSSAILAYQYIGPQGGVGPSNVQTGSYPAPSVTGVSETIEASTSAACDVKVSATFGNEPGAPATRILWYARLNGAASWSYWGETPLAAAAFKYASLVNGANYDFACAYAGIRGDDLGTIGTLATNVTVSPLSLPTTSLPKMPVGTTVSVASVTINSYAGSSGATQTASVTYTPTVTPPAGDNRPFSQWGAGYYYWAKVNDSGASDGDTNVADYIPCGLYSQNTSGSAITDNFGPLGAGHAWQLAIQPIDQQGNPGPLAIVGLTAAQQIGTPALGDFSAAPTITANSATSRAIARGMLQQITVTFTESNFGGTAPFAKPANLDHIELLVDVEGDTSESLTYKVDPTSPQSFTGTTATYAKTIRVPAGSSASVSARYVGVNGKLGASTALSNCQGIGDPNGDFFDTGDPNGGILHARSSPGVRGVINEDGSAAQTQDWLPDGDTYARVHGSELTDGLVMRLNDGTRIRTAANVAAVINSSLDDFGSGIVAGQVHAGIVYQPGATGPHNLAYNPTFANGSSGWSGLNGRSLTTDAFGGGRAHLPQGASVTTGAQQLIDVTAGQPMVAQCVIEIGGTALPSGTTVQLRITDQNGTYLASSTGVTSASGTTRVFQSCTFTSPSSGQVFLQAFVNNGAVTNGADIIFYKFGLEYGSVPSPWVDHNASALVNHTHNSNGLLDLSLGQQQVIGSSSGSDGSAILSGMISNRHLQSLTVAGTQVLPAVYSTQQVNTATNSADWADLNGNDIQQNATPLGNGWTYQYNTGSSAYQGNATPRGATYVLPASGSATFKFIHNAFASGGNGKPRIAFTGTVSGGSLAQQSTPVSGSQGVTWVNSPRTKIIGGDPVTTDFFSQSNGTAQSYTVTTGVDPATDAINLNLSSVSCPADSNGYSDLTITLSFQDGTVIDGSHLTISGSGTLSASGSSVSATGVSAATTITYHPASGSKGAGSYTWTIQAIAHNDDTSGVTYNGSYTVSFSGTASYWQNNSSAQTYVLASDGVTQRTSVLDSDVQLTQVGPGQFAVTVHNSSTTSALSFSLGMDVSGV